MFKTYDRCIFCFKEILDGSKGDGEHVIPKNIYGFWRIYDVCEECRQHFGDKIDQLALKNVHILNAMKRLELPSSDKSQVSNRPVKVGEPHFKVFPEFVVALYMKRYQLFCRKLILERHYASSSLITSASDTGIEGVYNEPANDLSFKNFAKYLFSHVGVFV